VTFSGGGGSGAAAVAVVGSGTILRSLGSSMSLYTPNGETFRVADTSGNIAPNTMWLEARGATASDAAVFFGVGGTSSKPLIFNNNAQYYSFRSTAIGGVGNEQLRVSHTASAVNYVQVTGAATGSAANIQFTSSGGGDTNVLAAFGTKGTGSFSFYSNGLTNRQVRIDGTIAAVNYLDFYGAVAGSAPSVRVGGTDNNIDLALTPKGTGVVVVNTNLGITSLTASTSATTADQVLAAFDATLYRTIKLTVQATDGTNYQSTEILAIHNGNTANHTEYGTVTVGSACASYTVDYFVGTPSTVRLLATPTSATSTTYKIAAYLTKL